MSTWTHRGKAGFAWRQTCHIEDPVNLLIENASLNDVLTHLQSRGWSQVGLWPPKGWASSQYLRRDDRCDKIQSAQLVKGPLTLRYHVRFWEDGDTIIGAAHYEKLSFPTHEVLSFEKGEQEVQVSFVYAPPWHIQPTPRDLRNVVDYPENDGFATVIVR